MPVSSSPNILWICTDQQRFDTIAALGNQHIGTPNIDRLVREGVAFTHAYCQSPICTPSRASFLTGMYPSSVHACGNGSDEWSGAAPLISKMLADSGYDCGLVGKLHLSAAYGRIERRPDDGYRAFHWSHSPKNNWSDGHAYAEWIQEKGHDLDDLTADNGVIPFELHQSTWCATKTVEFISEHREQPWLMSVNPFDPHPPFDPDPRYLARFNPLKLPGPHFRESDLAAQELLRGVDFQTSARHPSEFEAQTLQAAYYAMIEQIDENVGTMLDALERTGQRENTVVIFMSDHGEMLVDHGLILKGCRFYEGLVRVPLIFSWPGRIRENVISDALVELIDIVPTLLGFCNAEGHERIQGRSLAPILEGTAGAAIHRDFVRCEYYRALNPNRRVDTSSAQRERSDFKGSYGTMIRDERHKLAVYHGEAVGELFDLHQDPHEFENLWGSRAHQATQMRLLMQSFDALAFAVDLGPKQVAYF